MKAGDVSGLVQVDGLGLITLKASFEKKRTLWPVPGVFGSLKIDLTVVSRSFFEIGVLD